MRVLIVSAMLAVAASSAGAVTANWIDWTSSDNSNGFTAYGTITSGTESIGVTYNNPNGVSFIQTGSGTNYFTGDPSPYTSVGPNGNSNVPTPSEMIALRFAGTQTLTFSTPIQNLYYAFVSTNGNGYRFSEDFEILSIAGENIDGAGVDDRGFWGQGNAVRVENGDGTYSLNAVGRGEPHGMIFFDDVFTTLTWDSLTNENWNGFTVGVQGTQSQVSAVPLPAGGVLLLTAWGLLGWRRSRS